MRKLLLLALLNVIAHSLFATHIVGGEFEVRHIASNNYNVRLHLYNDDINGNPNAIDPYATVYIFRKSDNLRMESWGISLSKKTTVPVNYSNIDCQDQKLKTSHITYEGDIYLSPSRYNDPGGYYIVYERCCRNNTISNIYYPDVTGQTFYLEFPPVSVINSSPRLFPPLSDYACVGVPFNFNFAATDPDNDSLVYTLVTPLRGSSSSYDPAPVASPAPYRLVDWRPDYSENYQIDGTQTLSIGRNNGELSLIPSKLGLYVFAVKCEEYRNGVKIGEVRREFQLMVLDCPKNEKPAITFINPATNQAYVPGDTITLTENQATFDFTVKDPDVEDKLNIEARGTNLGNTRISLSQTTGTVNSSTNPSDSINSSLQLTTDDIRCKEPFSVRLIVKDNACSVPAQDAITVLFKYIESNNQAPLLSVNNPSDTIDVEINNGYIAFEVLGTDADSHLVQISANVNGMDPAALGINFPPMQGIAEVKGTFSWQPNCSTIKPGTYNVNFIINDVMCRPDNFDTSTVVVRIIDNNVPAILYASDSVTTTPHTITRLQVGNSVHLKLFGEDENSTNHLSLTAQGLGFDMASVDMSFPPMQGNSLISSDFNWDGACNHYQFLNKPLQVEFKLTEQTCESVLTKTMVYTFELIDTVANSQVPYNVVTPNGDGKNEYFSLEEVLLESCVGNFEYVEVYNRWGKLVFKDTIQSFRWEAQHFNSGVYYYFIKFTNRDFKGWVTVLK